MAVFYLIIFIIILVLISPFIVGGLFFYLTGAGLSFLELSLKEILPLLLLIIIGSFINIPLGKRSLVKVREAYFFGIFKRNAWRFQGVSVNIGGAVIPILIAGYFAYNAPFEALLATTVIVSFFSFLGAQFVKTKGVFVSMTLPILFSAFFAVLLSPESAPQVAFSAGVFGVLIGADLLYLPWAMRKGSGVVSIGGAGLLDAIFLTGIASSLLAGL